VISRVGHLVSDMILAPLEVGRILVMASVPSARVQWAENQDLPWSQ
jgi:hypothetical protein